MSDNSHISSPLYCGARRGFILGGLLALMFLLSMASRSSALASLAFLLGLIAVPCMVYKWLRATYLSEKGFSQLSSLWMQGIVIFSGASLICTTLAVAYFRWVEPDFVYTVINSYIDVCEQSAQESLKNAAQVLRNAQSAGVLPTATDVALEMFWLTMFAGSMLSLAVSAIVRAIPIKSAYKINSTPDKP